MSSPWKFLPNNVPSDGETVWIRTALTTASPFQAVWSESYQTFTDTTYSLSIPWFCIQKWRAL